MRLTISAFFATLQTIVALIVASHCHSGWLTLFVLLAIATTGWAGFEIGYGD